VYPSARLPGDVTVPGGPSGDGRLAEGPAPPKVTEYRLHLDVDVSGLAFRGTLEADLTGVEGPVQLDAVELLVHDAAVNGRPSPLQMLAEPGGVVLSSVPPGDCTIRVAFDGRVRPGRLTGLYRSSYGEVSVLTTQCAMTDARRVFPCLDRPDRKAPIHLTLTIPSELEAVFNTPVESESREGPTKTVVFAPTPPMATYLFYLGIGRFDRHRGPPGRVRTAVYAPPGRGSEGAFAVAQAARLLPAFEEYYHQPYPLAKLDLLAVPDFAWGAMENWGAITFREYRLLVTPTTPTRLRRLTLDTLAHEIAHQWFGNLVTMRWWDDVWLNESFATFAEVKIVDRVYPEHGALGDFLIFWTSRALLVDSLASTRPVSSEVRDASEVAEKFDDISYGKGASVLRMIDRYLGEERFRAGVSEYLARHKYGNATSRDLWDALDRAAGEPVHALLGPWTERPGIPLVSVHQESPGLVLRQRRFQLDGNHSDTWWPVPLTAELNGEHRRFRMDGPRLEIPVAEVRSLCFNPNATGFFRVLYEPSLYELILGSFSGWAPPDQWAVLQDLFAFLFSGNVSAPLYARFVTASQRLTAYLPIRQLSDDLTMFHRLVGRHPVLTAPAEDFLRAHYHRLGPNRIPGEPELDGVLREQVAAALVEMDDAVARELAAQFPDRASADRDLRPVVALAYSRIGGASAHVALRRAAESAPSDEEKLEIGLALAFSKEPDLVEATLRLLDDGVLAPAHVPLIVRAAAENPQGRDPTWAWIQRRLEAIGNESRGTLFASYILEFTLPYVGLGRRGEVAEWLRTHRVTGGARGAATGLALLDAAEALRRQMRG
jgi:tricorn protease interacting factor F2/3